MTVRTIPAGAVSHETMDWHAIHWPQVHRIVRRLQARIVKAVQAGRWGKVHALQHLLTHSFSGKALAVRRVTENPGKRTPGVDGDLWETPAKKAAAISRLRRRGYQARPLRRVWIPKPSSTKLRPLSIPTMQDRAMQALYLLALAPIAETTADRHSYGFRPERCTADALEQCRIVLSRHIAAPWILEGDIQACFDAISHEWLLANIPMDKSILRQWLKAGFMMKHAWYPTETGTPQGGTISPVLCNLTLDGLEKRLKERFGRTKTGKSDQVNLVRWADDFVITGRTQALLEQEVKPLLEHFLRERGLTLSPEKTRITHIDKGFDFLGQTIRKYGGTYLAQPAKKNVKAFLENVRGIIQSHKQATAGHLLVQLNPVIRGWAQYHRHSASKRTFDKVDSAIFTALWRWATRRHPQKTHGWIRRKYFRSLGDRHWVFHGDVVSSKGERKAYYLFKASKMPIKRYTKLKADANPYDPQWEVYFEHRLGVKMEANLRGRRHLLQLWKAQEGICPICSQKITTLTGWHNHHIVWRSHGGSDRTENHVLLHPNCHRQVHSQGLTVVKPRPATGV
jgi:RNA-directed DNA polymerase